jgi:mannose-1-phosphate guanylyltransferase / mannose-6-phosphate isomerase
LSLPSTSITPVILCGGSGTRLWLLSRKLFPKLFMPVISNKSLRQHKLELVKQANYIQEM